MQFEERNDSVGHVLDLELKGSLFHDSLESPAAKYCLNLGRHENAQDMNQKVLAGTRSIKTNK